MTLPNAKYPTGTVANESATTILLEMFYGGGGFRHQHAPYPAPLLQEIPPLSQHKYWMVNKPGCTEAPITMSRSHMPLQWWLQITLRDNGFKSHLPVCYRIPLF